MSSDAAATPSDADLLARARAGDSRAHAALFERHRRVLEGRIRRLLPPAVRRKVSVSDVLQEARILASERVGSFAPRHEGAYRAWVLRIADLKAREARRGLQGTAKRAVGREVSSAHASARSVAGRGPSPSQAAMSVEVRAAVLRTLESLYPDDGEVLRLANLEGRPLREVADLMGRSTDAVKKLYGRALQRFARAFEAREGPRR